jgi:hypothetical protein
VSNRSEIKAWASWLRPSVCYRLQSHGGRRAVLSMLIRIATASLAIWFAWMTPLLGQDQPAASGAPAAPAPIATDRPAFTNSSVVVPAGSFQAENGFEETSGQGLNVADAPETLIAFGLTARTELRFDVPDYYYNLNGSGRNSGFGDLAFGVKQQLGPLPGGFDVSATVFLSCPTGAKAVSSGGYDPGLQVAWSRALNSKWTAAGMFALYDPTQGDTRNLTGQFTILIDRQLTPIWDAFVEYGGNYAEYGGTQQYMHFGTALKLGKRQQQQLDFHFGVGLTPAASDHFVGIGYSFRFQAFQRK